MALLKVENLTIGYKNKRIVEDISFEINKSELIALLGPNGSGKTTLLKTINGLIKPLGGRCLLKGKDSQAMKDKARAQRISYMPQTYNMPYDIPIIDVVLMGISPYLHIFESPSKKHRDLACEILKSIGIDKEPNTNFNSLSEGQKQLVIIARNIMQNGDLMLFDEPDSALDFINKHMIMARIRNMIKSKRYGGLITLHDPNYALEYCDRIIILKDARVVDDFSTKNLNIDLVNHIFTRIYKDVEVIQHKGKFIITRSDYETRI